MNVQGSLPFTQTFRVEILSIEHKQKDYAVGERLTTVADPDLQIREGPVIQTLRCGGGGGGERSQKNFPAFGYKNKGGWVRAPQAPPLDPPLHYKVYSNLLNILKTVKRL